MDILQENEVEAAVEIVCNQLYFAVLKTPHFKRMKSNPDTYFFTIDEELVYHNFYCDFGPLNISCVYKFCNKLNKYLEYAKGLKRVIHYTSKNPEKKANAAFLMGAFSVIYLKMNPNDIYRALSKAGPYKNFLDASQCPCQNTLKLLECLNAIYKAMAYNFFNFEDFSVIEYDLHDKLQYGDMNWLVPRKFLAFIGPTENEFLSGHPPDFYVNYFLKNDVKTVIRLNNKLYDSVVFTQVGIEHFDLIFPDGTTPPKDILLRFLNIAENSPGAIAVHCKAGLGRTGSLIGAYIMKHYKMTAKEAIAWMRICRPGSVIGQQQGWLEKLEPWLWKTGHQFRMRRYGEGDKIPKHQYGIYSKLWPEEREKIVRETKKKIQNSFTRSQLERVVGQKIIHSKSQKSSLANKSGIMGKTDFKMVSKMLSSIHGGGSVNKSFQDLRVKSKGSGAEDRDGERSRGHRHRYAADDLDRRFKGRGKPSQGDKLIEIKAKRTAIERSAKNVKRHS